MLDSERQLASAQVDHPDGAVLDAATCTRSTVGRERAQFPVAGPPHQRGRGAIEHRLASMVIDHHDAIGARITDDHLPPLRIALPLERPTHEIGHLTAQHLSALLHPDVGGCGNHPVGAQLRLGRCDERPAAREERRTGLRPYHDRSTWTRLGTSTSLPFVAIGKGSEDMLSRNLPPARVSQANPEPYSAIEPNWSSGSFTVSSEGSASEPPRTVLTSGAAPWVRCPRSRMTTFGSVGEV